MKIQNSKFKIQNYNLKCKILISVLLFCLLPLCYAQEVQQNLPLEATEQETVEQTEVETEAQTAIVESLATSQNVTLDFKEADIRNVLKIISYKAGVNIVTTPEVMGNVTIRLVDVPWEKALDVILKTYGFAYEKVGNIITVAPIEKLTSLKKQEVELAQVQPTVTEVFQLRYIEAQDTKRALELQLSPRGKITILEMAGQAGWEFGGAEIAKRKRVREEMISRSKTLIISDIPPVLDKIREVIERIDIRPKQILIKTRLMEVNRDRLKDIGFDWGTGTSGATSTTLGTVPVDKSDGTSMAVGGGQVAGSHIEPYVFDPKSTLLKKYPFDTGLEFVFRKLTGTQFEVLLHALEEDIHSNTISAPSIMALNNQEASILVGTKYPILKSEQSTQASGYTVAKSLDYYQDVGIQLNVVPQVSGLDFINMVIHPAVSSRSGWIGDTASAAYPIIDIREAETRILLKDGETVVIGGLLKDIKKTGIVGVPFLRHIPIFGLLFQRHTTDIEKIDLLIFITANIVKDEDFSPEVIAKLQENLGKEPKAIIKKKKR